jgi:hypothetical protein
MLSLNLSDLKVRLDRPHRWEPELRERQLAFCLRSGHSQQHAFSWALTLDEKEQRATLRGAAFRLHAMGGLMARLAAGGGLTQQQLVDESLVRIVDVPMMFFTARTIATELDNLRLPVVGLAEGAAVDASAHHLVVMSDAALVELAWSGDGPPGWEPLVAWATKTRTYLHSLTNPDEPLY